MSISGIKSNNSMLPTLKGKNNISRSTVAKQAFTQNASFGSSVLPSKTRISGFVGARSTKMNPAYQSGAQISSRLNSGQVRYRAGLDAAFGPRASVNTNYKVDNSSQEWMQFGMSLAQVGLQVADKLGVFDKLNGTTSTPTSNSTKLQEGLDALGGNSNIPTATTLHGQMTGATSFKTLNQVEKDLAQKKQNLNEGYSKIGQDAQNAAKEILGGEGVQAGLEAAGVQINTEALNLSALDPQDLAECQKIIDSDINKITNFQTDLISNKLNSVTAQLGQTTQEISITETNLGSLRTQLATTTDTSAKLRLQNQINELETKLKELNTKKENLDKAKDAINQLDAQCKDTIESLKTKQAEIKDMEKTENEIKDKKFDLAKKQDQELDKTMKEIDKINKEIASIVDKDPNKTTKSDQKHMDKIKSLISQREGLYSTLSQLITSLSAADPKTVTNSKGATYPITNLKKATDMASSKPPVEIPPESGTTEAPAKEGGELAEVQIQGYTKEQLAKMDLHVLTQLKGLYDRKGDTESAARIDKFIKEKNNALASISTNSTNINS